MLANNNFRGEAGHFATGSDHEEHPLYFQGRHIITWTISCAILDNNIGHIDKMRERCSILIALEIKKNWLISAIDFSSYVKCYLEVPAMNYILLVALFDTSFQKLLLFCVLNCDKWASVLS